uniref:RING-type E3 ubiquitin transferase n=1 Tax=Oryza punctata TaxID=4537 RepID=A0A1V1H910_ORYPU|nr:putative TPR1 [Oryza punctata]
MAPVHSHRRGATEANEQMRRKAQREKDAGDDDYDEGRYKRAVEHYARAAALDPGDISFPIKCAKSYFHMDQYEDCVRRCDEAVERGRELRSKKSLVAQALFWKGTALLNLADCASDCNAAIRALKQSLDEHYNKGTEASLDEAESTREEMEELEKEAAKHHRDKGKELLSQKKHKEAAIQFTKAIKKNPTNPRNFSDRAKCRIELNALAEGLEDADKSIELDPTFWKGYLRKAEVQFLTHNYEDAMTTYLDEQNKMAKDRDDRAKDLWEAFKKSSSSQVKILKMQRNVVTLELKSAKERNASLEQQLFEQIGRIERLLSIQNREPPHFICPISQEVMNDPHFAADGHTYEAEHIRKWLNDGHDTSPMTNERLQHKKLTPNHALRSAIREWHQHRNMRHTSPFCYKSSRRQPLHL